jgi:hypothetical protein
MRNTDLNNSYQRTRQQTPSQSTGFGSGVPNTPAPITKRNSAAGIECNTFPISLSSTRGKLIVGKNSKRRFLLIQNQARSTSVYIALSFGRDIFGNMSTLELASVNKLGAFVMNSGATPLQIDNHTCTNEIYGIVVATACTGIIDSFVISVTEGVLNE